MKTVIVAHQGTNPEEIAALATDADAFQVNLDSSLFPGIDSSIEVHNGFANEQAKTANDVLSAVRQTISKHGANSITVVGHSLGAAIALLDTVFLSIQVPGVPVKMVGFGLPRVGNQAFANFVDANLQVTHITNQKDPIPIVPGRDLGYHHPSGEVHINEAGTFNACAGQDNPSNQCSTGDVPNILEGNLNDHDGPYNGIIMGC
jgi:predicted lipase